ncbi:MAG: hypothetical protein R3324_00105 [Halobacteriales archaeon]|nr:hypothetical protein [Halobacteriales archaeon]
MRPAKPSTTSPTRKGIRRVGTVDLIAVSVVPLALATVHLQPMEVKRSLVLAYMDPTVWTAFTSHFVHLDGVHLATNILTYAVIVTPLYLLCLVSGNRDRFWAVYLTVIFAFPFAISALNVALARPRIGLGFSSLNMAFLGFLPIALVWYLGDQFDPRIDPRVAPGFFFLGTGLIAVLAVPDSVHGVVIASSSAVAALLFFYRGEGWGDRSVVASIKRAAARPGYFELAVVPIIVYVLVPFAAFPAEPIRNGSVLNLYAHQLGFCLGFIVPYTTFRILDRPPTDAIPVRSWLGVGRE